MDERLLAVLCFLVRYEITFNTLDTAVAYVNAQPELADELVKGPMGDVVRDLLTRLESAP